MKSFNAWNIAAGKNTIISLRNTGENKLTHADFLDLSEILKELSTDSSLRTLSLTSESPSFFSNGLDLHSFSRNSMEAMREEFETVLQAMLSLLIFPLPVLSIVSGHATGAAAILFLMADYRFSTDQPGRFGFPEVKIGLPFPQSALSAMERILPSDFWMNLILRGELVKIRELAPLGISRPLEEAGKNNYNLLIKQLNSIRAENLRNIKEQSRSTHWQESLRNRASHDARSLADSLSLLP